MKPERRKHKRIEVNSFVYLFLPDQGEITGYILDASLYGLAVTIPTNADHTLEGKKVQVFISNDNRRIQLGDAVILRTWSESRFYSGGLGFALKFEHAISSDPEHTFLTEGITKDSRIETQDKLVQLDMDYLSSDRRAALDVQFRLFVFTLTVAVALAVAYLGLANKVVSTGTLGQLRYRLWRILMTGFPGVVAMASAVIFFQKLIFIQQINAYLSLVKEWRITKQYPREYRGWEPAYYKFRNVLGSSHCESCEIAHNSRKCGLFLPSETSILCSRSIIDNLSTEQFIMFFVIIFILVLSLIMLLFETGKYNDNVKQYMIFASSTIMLISVICIQYTYAFYHIFKGKYSYNYYRRCWLDLLMKCYRL